MNSEPPRRPPQDDADLGAPIAALAQLAEEPEQGFLARVRRRIQRRSLTAQLFDLSCLAPILVFFEYLNLILQAVLGGKNSSDNSKEEGPRHE